MEKYYVYVLKSLQNGSYYKGSTGDVSRRLEEHNSGKEPSTSRYRPWELVGTIEKLNKSEAIQLERKLKNLRRDRLESFLRKYCCGGPDDPQGGCQDTDK